MSTKIEDKPIAHGGEWICETKECRTVVCTRIAKNGKHNT
jgi:hypothetical protein